MSVDSLDLGLGTDARRPPCLDAMPPSKVGSASVATAGAPARQLKP